MSNERSPRDVCSITIGINGLINYSLLAGVHKVVSDWSRSFSGVQSDAAALEREGEPLEERPSARLDERPRRLHLRCLGERAHDLLPERRLRLELEVVAQPGLDVLAELGEGLELARRAGEVVVE